MYSPQGYKTADGLSLSLSYISTINMISVKLLILALIAIIAKVSSLTINTPNGPKACEKLSITFDGGSAPVS